MTRRPTSARGRGRLASPTALVVPAVLALLALAACTAESTDPLAGTSASTSTAPTATGSARPTSPPPPTAAATAAGPLTGLRVPAATAARAAVAVAVRTTTGTAARGLDSADLVYVSYPGTGRQRMLGVFQSRDSSAVGPVDETRPVDPKLLVVTRAVLAFDGGQPGFVKQIDAAGLPQWNAIAQPSGFATGSDGRRYASTTAARAAPGAPPARGGLLTFGVPARAPAAAPRPVSVYVAGQPPLRLVYDVRARVWTGVVGSTRLRATNVVVQRVAYSSLLLPRSGGATEGNPEVIGTGSAAVLAGARVNSGTWYRPSRNGVTNVADRAKQLVRLAPGTTWWLLVPTTARVG